MSRTITQDILDKLESNEITSFHLLEFTINSTTYRFTDCEIPIHHATDGTTAVTFTPRAFTFDNLNYSTADIVDSCTLTIDNLDSVLTALFLGNVILENEASIWLVILNSDHDILGSTQLFKGHLNNFDLDEVEVKITISSIFTKWSQTSYSKHSALCRWPKFKGTECGYSGGESTCDRSYARCVVLGNTNNFGGFRWIPKQEDKKRWWGVEGK